MKPSIAPRTARTLTAKEARLRLATRMSNSAFWDLVRQYNVPRRQFGPRAVVFEEAVIEELINFFTVRTPSDLRRVTDARHKFSWSEAAA